MSDGVTIWYRGARCELGLGPGFFGTWAVGEPRSQPLEQWPQTPEGWSAAWARFTSVEAPGSIVHLSQDAVAATGPASAGPAAGGGTVTGPLILLAVGVACGIAGLFPGYVAGTSLAHQSFELIPHVIYLAAWAASTVLILLGGTRRWAGTLLGLGTSVVTLGLFFADLGTAINSGTRAIGAGLLLGLISWLTCTAGAALAFRPGPAGAPARPRARPGGPLAALVIAVIAAAGAAFAFAPAWDRYTLRMPSGLVQSFTAGNSFANPGLVIAGDVTVMAALVIVAVIAALWRPARLGAVLLAGATIPMVAQAASALTQIATPTSPSVFGVSPSQAAQLGLTISAGLTPVFWIYCAFVAVLIAMVGWMLRAPRALGAPRPAGDQAPVPDPASGLAASLAPTAPTAPPLS